MRNALRRSCRLAAVSALALAGSLGGSVTATADAPGHSGFTVDVNLTAAGIQAPDSHPAGTVTFRISTDDPGSRQLQIFKPHPGVSIDQMLADTARAFDPATAAEGIRALNADGEALGGATATPANAAIMSEDLAEGTVYLVDLTPVQSGGAPLVKPLELCKDAGYHLPHFPHGIVIQHETDQGPRFQTEDVDKAEGSYYVHNSATELHEMAIQPVAPGTTDEQVQQFFDGTYTGPPLFTGTAVGLGVVSPDHSVVFHEDKLAPGTYVLLCFIPDDSTGIPHAFEGMHKVVELK
ncbi:hypothetical protein C7C46_22945 [Streptomyces tateyamensis]|uniref:Spondin domain-containing protein n=1 Tax=Streptomyces tateyamensis TaxID=565073 RepID=A0A2V4NL52_9ACTN|nr:hypothetical protein [Streptomyces tateyamensis]PYC76333.1 hypothetical protein C7C46_22945 [Streptomyces tateyamensis]